MIAAALAVLFAGAALLVTMPSPFTSLMRIRYGSTRRHCVTHCGRSAKR